MKKVYKKIFVTSLALTAASLTLSACANNSKKKDVSIIVDTNKLEGDFFTSAFSASTGDQDVRKLLFSTGTMAQNSKEQMVINSGVVTNKEIEKSTDADGNTVVRWTLRDDLKWSDGQKITANDYAFSYLFQYSPAWAEVGASVNSDDSLVGQAEYIEGKTDVFKGIRVVDDKTFELVISKDKFPYYYEGVYFNADALPLHELGLGAKVVSSAEGVKLEGADYKKIAENAKKTQVDSWKPTVTYGNYVIDKASETEVILKLNDKYQGNFEGAKPEIPTIIIKPNKNSELRIQRLQNGEVDLVSGVIEAQQLKTAKETESISLFKYPRAGFGYLGMTNEFGPTADINVRHAIGHLTNRNEIINSYLAGNGIVLNGDYATSQWMSQEKEAELNEKLNQYSYDIDAANAELDKSSYRFEEDGTTPFDKSKASESYLRYNDKKEPLVLRHLGTENNPITEKLKTNFLQDAPKVGMKYQVDTSDFPTLLKALDLSTANSPEQKYHLFNLATGYATVFDPYTSSFHSRNLGRQANQYRVNDKELDKAIEAMRNVPANDQTKYAEEWFKYQQRWNELLPQLPLYANIYHDAYNNKKIAEYKVTPLQDWAASIEYIKLK